MLELRRISKNFGSFAALRNVDFKVEAGEIVGLLGENGAGKSTLLSIVSGNLPPSSGMIAWHKQAIELASPRDATRLGIGVVHQHFKLVPEFTVAENVALQAPRSSFFFREQEWRERIAQWAGELGWRIDPARKIEELSVGERQRVEILKALFVHDDVKVAASSTAQLLLLDEPTANLTPDEVRELFVVLRRLREQGRGIVLVSHKLKEVLALCDRAVVLRRGIVAGERTIAETDANELAELMVGRALGLSVPNTPLHQVGEEEVVLNVEHLSAGMLREVSLQVRRGEIVGIAGVDGNGQSELLETLSGLRASEQGSVRVAQNRAAHDAQSEIALIPADRQHVGLIARFSLYENLALHPALRHECKGRFGFDWNKARQRTRELMEKFDVRAPASAESTPAAQLSGGNQQKLVIARALSFPHSVVIASDPTRGLDVAASQFVHEQLREAAAQGAGLLLISTDLDEVLSLSDRIGVLYEGKLLPEEGLLARDASRELIGSLMGGVVQESQP